ncbi:MAG TPA: hypothetical protein VK498_14800, partial [Ferruginibacter sp.]|nr:hypothetical protein [Ferruginibacter sp.]
MKNFCLVIGNISIKKEFTFLILFCFFLKTGLGQVNIVADGLNNSSSVFTSIVGGTYYTGNSASGDRPASSPFASEGTHGFGFSGPGNAVLTSGNISTLGYTGVQLTLKVAAFSINSNGN